MSLDRTPAMLLMLPFALLGLAALFHFLLLASSRALSIGAAVSTAFAAEAAGVPLLWAAGAGILTFALTEIAAGIAGTRLNGRPAGTALAVIFVVPALVAGYSVGALAASWFGTEPTLPGAGAALIAGLIPGRHTSVRGA
jgi:hypothetical protein